jgi:DnaJ family protein C protein 28
MVEDVIQEALERGDFDNLPGKGKPLNLAPDPLLDPMMAIVNRILRDNGLSHPLIEARKTIADESEQCRAELQHAWREYRRSHSEVEWAEAIGIFRTRVRQLNREVRIFNLKAPSPALHGLAMDADAEVARVTQHLTQHLSNQANDRTSNRID